MRHEGKQMRVTEYELRQLKPSGGLGIPLPVSLWAMYFGAILNRKLTKDEASDAIARLNKAYSDGS